MSVEVEVLARRMSALDAAFLYFERPHAPLTIGAVAVLDGAASRDEILRHLDTHLNGFQRFSQRAIPAPFSLAHPAWVPDPEFDLRNHVHHFGVPHPGGGAELCETVAELLGQPLDRSRPLWEAHLLEGLVGDRSAVLYRAHHCMIDGVAGASALDSLLDAQPASSRWRSRGSAPGDPGRRSHELGRILVDSISSAWRRSSRTVGLLHDRERLKRGLVSARGLSRWAVEHLLEGPSRLPWNGAIGRRRRVAFTRFGLEDVRAIGVARRCTVNDVVLCVLAGGLRHYLETLGIDPARQPMVAAVPVSLRAPMQGTVFGNRLGLLLVPLVLDPRDEVERLERTAAITRRLKQEPGHDTIAALLAAADLLPPALLAWLGRRTRIPSLASVIATNVRGPATHRYLAGRRVEALYPIVPIADGLGLGLAVLSYAGSIHVGLNADADRVPDVATLCAGIHDAAVRLVRGVSKGPKTFRCTSEDAAGVGTAPEDGPAVPRHASWG